MLLDLQLAEVAEEEIFAIVHLVLAGEDVLLDLIDLFADHFVCEVHEYSVG